MIAVWPWIKRGVVLIPLLMAFFLALQLKTVATERAMLAEKLKQVSSLNADNEAEIKQLITQNANLEQLFKQKQQRQQQVEGQLRDNISSLRQALAQDECYQRPWPRNVVERLQQHY